MVFYRQRHLQNWVHFFVEKKSKQVLKELLQKNWGQLILLSILLKLSLSPSNICLKNIFQLNWNSWLKSYIKHGNKCIISYQVLIVSRDRGKPVRDLTGLICFFYNKMDSVLKMSLSIEYHTRSDPPLAWCFDKMFVKKPLKVLNLFSIR